MECIALRGLSHPWVLYFAGISLTRWFPDSWGCWYFPVCWCTSGDQCGANAGASLTPQSSQSSFQSSVIIICKPGSHLSKFPKIAASNPLIFKKITWTAAQNGHVCVLSGVASGGSFDRQLCTEADVRCLGGSKPGWGTSEWRLWKLHVFLQGEQKDGRDYGNIGNSILR